MTKLFKLAWRNVWRNRRRSLITMGAIFFSVLIIALTRSLQYGSYDAMESFAIRLFTGDLQVQRAGYQEEQTLADALREDERDWDGLLAAQPWHVAHARRLTGFGLAGSDETSAGALIVGIEPEAEPAVSHFLRKIVAGAPLAAGDDHRAVLGQTLAQNLSLGVGDTVVVIAQGYRNEMGADLYVVKGLFDSGSAEMDRATMVLSLADAQALFSMPGRFTQLAVRTDDFRRAGRYAERLEAALADTTVDVLDWNALMPELRQMIVLDNASGAIFLAFMLLLIGFEIFNTTMMSVMERVREFGVLQAIGMKPGQISLLVVLELLIKVALALAVSLVVTGAAVAYLAGHPIPLSAELRELYEEFGFSIDALVFSGRPRVFVEPLLSVAAVSLLTIVYPALRVLRFSPVAALRRA
ncbi:MAG: transporter [Rhodothermaceae bacterium]|nr:MAG: transporter [Rhodothermaceae bacterium]